MAPRLVQTGQQVRIVDDSDQMVAAFSRDQTGDTPGSFLASPKYARRRLDNSRGNDRKAMATPPTFGITTTVTGVNAVNSATINVGSTTGFLASGAVSINGVAVTYTGVTATSFTGCGNHPAYVGGEVVVGYSTATGIASAISWPAVAQASSGAIKQLGDHFTYHGAGSPAIFGTVFPNYQYIAFNSLTDPGAVTAPHVASFYFDGTQIEFQFKGVGNALMIKVDDEYVSLTPVFTGNTGSTYFLPLTFASRLVRRIDVITSGLPWGGVMTGPNDTIVAAETRGPRMIVLGDSFTGGSGADAGTASNWVRTFADLMGWDDVWPSGVGGVGYLNPGTGGRVKLRDRVAHDVLAYNPDIVVVAAGHNDIAYNPGGGVVTSAQIGAEALALFQQIVASLPSALLVVTSPFWHGGASTMSAALIAARDAIKNAVLSVGGTFIDVLEQPLPSYVTPISTTLSVTVTAGAATVSLPVVIPQRSVLQIGSDRAEVKSIAGGGPFLHSLDGTLVGAHTSGDPVTQVGSPLWTGTGHAGATTGYGNSDLLVGVDGIHPTQAGHNILGTTLARLMIRSGVL